MVSAALVLHYSYSIRYDNQIIYQSLNSAMYICDKDGSNLELLNKEYGVGGIAAKNGWVYHFADYDGYPLLKTNIETKKPLLY